MEFSGTLEQTPLVNTLQRYQAQRITGELSVQGGFKGEEIRIYLVQGRVVHVKATHRPEPMRLGMLVCMAGLTDVYTVRELLQNTTDTASRLGDGLLAMRKIEPQALEDLLTLQFKNDILRASLWKQGSYEFNFTDIPADMQLMVPIETKSIVGPILKLIQNWDTVQTLIPSRYATFRTAFNGPIPAHRMEEHNLEELDSRVFEHLSPQHNIFQSFALLRLSPLELYPCLIRLSFVDLIEKAPEHHDLPVVDPNESPNLPPVLAENESPLASSTQLDAVNPENPDTLAATKTIVRKENTRTLGQSIAFHTATTILVVALLAVGLKLFISSPELARSDHTFTLASQDEPLSLKQARTRSQIQRIRHALHVYERAQGEYPARLELLVETGLLETKDLTWPHFQNPYVYRPQGESFVLIRPKR